MKTCYTCKGHLYEEKFVKRGDGRLNQCKKCANKLKKIYRSTPEARQQQKEYREANKDKAKKYMRNYHQVKTMTEKSQTPSPQRYPSGKSPATPHPNRRTG